MSDDAEPAPEPVPAPPPRNSSSKLVPGLLIVNIAATALVAFKVLTAHPVAAAVPHTEGMSTAGQVKGPIATLEPFVANLDEPGTPRYIKLTVELELANVDSEHALAKAKQSVRDQVLGYLSGLKIADTLGETARQKIRDGLLARINTAVGEGEVRRMFFSEFMVQ